MSISRMKKLTVLTPLADAERTVRLLLYRKCVEVKLTDISQSQYLERYCQSGERAAVEARISEIENAKTAISKFTGGGLLPKKRLAVDRDRFVSDGSFEDARKAVKDINESVLRIVEIGREMTAQEDILKAMEPWQNYNLPLGNRDTKFTRTELGTLPPKTDFSEVEEKFEDLDAYPELIKRDKNAVYISVVYHKSEEDGVRAVLGSLSFVAAPVKGISDSPQKVYTEAGVTLESLISEREELKEKLIDHGRNDYDGICVLGDIEKTNLRIQEIKEKLAATRHCAVLEGWVPEDCEEKVSKLLISLGCAFETEDPDPEEDPPVLLKNNKFARSFEWVVGMYSYPKYGTYDPTFIMGIFYCAIFGFMFADVGYGLIMIIGGFLGPKLLQLRENMKRMFNMFGYCGFSCAICGVLFGGWFGDTPISIFGAEAGGFFSGLWLNPMNDSLKFLIVSLGIGVIHVLAGLAVKFVLLCKDHRFWSAMFDVFSWWLIFAGIGLFVAATMGLLPISTTVGIIVAGVGAGTIILTAGRDTKNPLMRLAKGLLGLYDIINYASDILSYSRILALGLAGSVIGSVINLIASMLADGKTGVSYVIGLFFMIVVFIIGHLLNIAINVLGAFVHTSRLQYIEFFGKFFVDGGEKFDPAEPCEDFADDITQVDVPAKLGADK